MVKNSFIILQKKLLKINCFFLKPVDRTEYILTNGTALFQAILNIYTSLVHTVPGTASLTLNSETDFVQY